MTQRLTLRKFQSPALEHVLPSLATGEVVLSSSRIAGGFDIARLEELLLAGQDGEIVVSEMDPGVAFSPKRGAEDDQVLSDRSVENDH